MRQTLQQDSIMTLLEELAHRARGEGRIYLTGGACAVLIGWRATTIDLDLKLLPEPRGIFEAIRDTKQHLHANIELAAPDNFIPELTGWQTRSMFIARFGSIDFFHYDFYAQALAKIERGHQRDVFDVAAMLDRKLINSDFLGKMYLDIEPKLLRYPAIDPAAFRAKVEAIVGPLS